MMKVRIQFGTLLNDVHHYDFLFICCIYDHASSANWSKWNDFMFLWTIQIHFSILISHSFISDLIINVELKKIFIPWHKYCAPAQSIENKEFKEVKKSSFFFKMMLTFLFLKLFRKRIKNCKNPHCVVFVQKKN